ncbi:MAG: ABC transporter substrate-binding protein, partial [Anaerolineae bacterium]
MRHKLLAVLSIIMILALVLTGCQPAATTTGGGTTSGTTYKVAIVVPLSGDVKTFGESTRDGAMMAIEAARAEGMNIEVVLADSKCDAQEATNAANKVITQDKVHYIIGEVCSSASIPIAALAEQNKVLQISPTSTNPA